MSDWLKDDAKAAEEMAAVGDHGNINDIVTKAPARWAGPALARRLRLDSALGKRNLSRDMAG